MGDGREIVGIVVLSVQVSLTASLIGMAIGAPLGGWICTLRGRARRLWLAVFSALLAVPTVVVGLVVYILLSRSGPLGWLDILFTPTAIIVAQVIITLPVITVFSHRACAGPWADHGDQVRLDIKARWRQVAELMRMARAGLVTAFLVAFGRAISEVGAVMIVGGNIRGSTRVMTTAITLETRQGNFNIAVALGVVLVAISFLVTVLTWWVTRERAMARP
ncbi:MAG: ABC transporter permease [Roseitalea sp.]|jgi:tungstate transport system permease protein|nr:ABC transporter permease [Roseitalea sp.]MBO6721269.1 ABC transporter permease [Roseitalea sp.]MBO6742247.1 ABC transporter permease [Roseitalea sp.]